MSAISHIGKRTSVLLLGALAIGLALYAVPGAILPVYGVGAAVNCFNNPAGGYIITIGARDVGNPSGGQDIIVTVPHGSCPPGLSTDPNNPTLGTLTVQCGASSDTLTFITSTDTYTWTVPTNTVPTSLC